MTDTAVRRDLVREADQVIYAINDTMNEQRQVQTSAQRWELVATVLCLFAIGMALLCSLGAGLIMLGVLCGWHSFRLFRQSARLSRGEPS